MLHTILCCYIFFKEPLLKGCWYNNAVKPFLSSYEPEIKKKNIKYNWRVWTTKGGCGNAREHQSVCVSYWKVCVSPELSLKTVCPAALIKSERLQKVEANNKTTYYLKVACSPNTRLIIHAIRAPQSGSSVACSAAVRKCISSPSYKWVWLFLMGLRLLVALFPGRRLL